MEQIEVMSWKTLDALKQTATNIYQTIGNLDTNEQMSIFLAIEDDFFELYFSELESNYIRHFEDEEELLKYMELRKDQFGEEDFGGVEYYDEENEFDDSNEDYSGYRIRDEEEEEDF
jgi:hypothetical protein